MCIEIVEIWFGIANWQILSILTELSACDMSDFSFPDDNLSKCRWIFNLVYALILYIGIAYGQILSIFDTVICPLHVQILVSGL